VYINKKNFHPEIKYNRLKHVRTWVEPKRRRRRDFFFLNQSKKELMPSVFIIFLLQTKPIDYETKQTNNKTKRKKKVAVVFTNNDNPTLSLHCFDTDQ
jgi:hypothetical protein